MHRSYYKTQQKVGTFFGFAVKKYIYKLYLRCLRRLKFEVRKSYLSWVKLKNVISPDMSLDAIKIEGNDRRTKEHAYLLCKKILRNCSLNKGFHPLAMQ